MRLFYSPDISGNTYSLNEEESKHCSKVLRLKEKDIVHLIDGSGGFYKTEIISISNKEVKVRVLNLQKNYQKKNYSLHIAIAPTKNNDRFEWFLEKATEIGIDEITPLLCEHSERKGIKPERFEKILVAAMKQSYKAYLPKLNPLIKFNDFISSTNADQKFIAHCEEGAKSNLKKEIETNKKILILIGPEGDFSNEEIELAKTKNYVEISLGSSRLRTETAGIVPCHSMAFIHDFNPEAH